MIPRRSLLVYILLSCITFGIYAIVFWHRWTQDVNRLCEADGKPSMGYLLVLLLSIVTGGIFFLIWLYQQTERIAAAGPSYGESVATSGTSVVLWYLLGSFILIGPFVALAKVFGATNQLAYAYNTRNGYMA